MRLSGWFDLGDAGFSLLAGMMLASTTAVVLAGLIGLTLRRRASARHAAWLCALAVVLLSPALAWSGRRMAFPIALPRFASTAADRPGRTSSTVSAKPVASSGAAGPKREASTTVEIDGAVHEGLPPAVMAEDVAFHGTPAPAARSVVAKSPPWLRIGRGAVVAVWLVGALGLFARLAWGFREVVKLRRTVRPLACEGVAPAVASAVGVSVERLPSIGVSARTSQPLTVGVIRPSVLIPEGLAANLSADALRDVLIHECAHAVRRDTVVGLLQRLAAILCWPNPLVHLMNRALESAREELCDNHVLRTSRPADYAASLLAVAERRPSSAGLDAMLGLPMIARRGTLESRIAALLDPRRHIETSMRRGAVAALAVVFLSAGAGVSAVRFGDAEQPPVAPSTKPLDSRKTRIEGVVVDESGKPAADVRVRCWAFYHGEPPETHTGKDGSFVLDVAFLGPFHLLASNADGSLQAFNRYVGGYRPSEQRLETKLVLKPARTTTVLVTDLQGAAVADASVLAHDQFAAFWQSRTDANGEARLRIASDAEPGSVIAFKSGLGLDYSENEEYWPGRKPDTLPDLVNLVLDGAVTVKVQAVDASNRPVPGMPFALESAWKSGKRTWASLGGPPLTRVTTDPDGIAVFDFVPKGLMQSPLFSLQTESPVVASTTEGDPKEPEQTIVEHLRWDVPVSGRVFKADGAPAPGIMVQAEGQGRPPHGQGIHYTRTGADGSYVLALHPEASHLIGVVDDQWAAPSRGQIVPREGTKVQNIDFHLESGTLVTGRVTSGADHAPFAGEVVALVERGANVEHLTVEVHGGSTSQFGAKTETLRRWTTTDPDGRFAFRVGPGSFALPDKQWRIERSSYWPSAYSIDCYDENAPSFQVKDQPEIKRDFQVAEHGEAKSFVVTVREGSVDGPPVFDAHVVASIANFEGGAGGIAPYTGRTDSQGTFRARNVGLVYVFARSADGALGGFGYLDHEDTETTLVLEKATTVSGRVVSENGTPIPRARLIAYLAGSQLHPEIGTPPDPAKFNGTKIVLKCDVQGRYKLTGLPVDARLHLTQPPYVGMQSIQDLESIDLIIEDLAPLTLPDLVLKSDKP